MNNDTPETTASGDTASPPIWYTENEMYQWLIRENYSEQIAKELSSKWADHLQGAFNKGFEKGARYREQIGGDTAKQDLIEAVKNLSYKCLQWENGEIKGYDETIMEGGLSKLFDKYFKLEEENARLRNDLLDALDLKNGNGPTALSILKEENARLRKLVEKAFSYGYWSNGVSKQTSWEQFKRDNGL